MTGYGVAEVKNPTHACLVEIKSLNNRFCDIYIKNNFSSLEIEQKIEKIIKEKLFRGKITVFIKIDSHLIEEEKVVFNEELASSYFHALKKMKKKLGIDEEITLGSMLRIKDVFQIEKSEKTAELWCLIEKPLQKALKSIQLMRRKEGKNLEKDIKSKIKLIEKEIKIIEEYAKKSIIRYKVEFLEKLKELTDSMNVEEGRIEMEAAVFAEKKDINEEIIRAKSHIEQFKMLLDCKNGEPVGRKMDFIIQEINREINTIGSKVNDINISSLVITIKSELEKVREQVRNIE